MDNQIGSQEQSYQHWHQLYSGHSWVSSLYHSQAPEDETWFVLILDDLSHLLRHRTIPRPRKCNLCPEPNSSPDQARTLAIERRREFGGSYGNVVEMKREFLERKKVGKIIGSNIQWKNSTRQVSRTQNIINQQNGLKWRTDWNEEWIEMKNGLKWRTDWNEEWIEMRNGLKWGMDSDRGWIDWRESKRERKEGRNNERKKEGWWKRKKKKERRRKKKRNILAGKLILMIDLGRPLKNWTFADCALYVHYHYVIHSFFHAEKEEKKKKKRERERWECSWYNFDTKGETGNDTYKGTPSDSISALIR